MRTWRNSDSVRPFMYNSKIITKEEHSAWFDKMLYDKTRIYWVIELENKSVGVVNLININKENSSCDWAFYIFNPDIRGKGVGSFVERFVLDYVFNELQLNKLNCEVLETNPNVVKMHEKFGFLDFEEVLKGAENYARNGFPVHEVEAKSWQEKEHRLKQNNNSSKIFLNNNRSYKFGEIFKNIPLANTLNTISKKKIDGFYNSDITKDMVESLIELGGLHTEDDFLLQKTIR